MFEELGVDLQADAKTAAEPAESKDQELQEVRDYDADEDADNDADEDADNDADEDEDNDTDEEADDDESIELQVKRRTALTRALQGCCIFKPVMYFC